MLLTTHVKGFVIPLITLTDDYIDDNDIINDDDDNNYSIEELENAVFSETEDSSDVETDNIRITEPVTDLEDTCDRGNSLEEGNDDITDDDQDQELSSPELDERAIPIR